MFLSLASLQVSRNDSRFIALSPRCPAVHLLQAVKFRMWWLFPTVILAGVLEILGWSARLWSSISPMLLTPFEIQ